MHSIHKGEVLFSLVCTFYNSVKNFEVDVDVRMGTLRFRE